MIGMLAGDVVPTWFRKHLGRTTAGMASDELARVGLSRTFQTPSGFAGLTVKESLVLAAPDRQTPQADSATRWLEALGLSAYAEHHASELPTGLLRKLEVARALITAPHVLLMDEPAAGLNTPRPMTSAA